MRRWSFASTQAGSYAPEIGGDVDDAAAVYDVVRA